MSLNSEKIFRHHDSTVASPVDTHYKLRQSISLNISSLKNWCEEYKAVFWATYAVTIITYSYIFTSIGFTNHTFPQAWTYSYPSYRTISEGRWFSDLLIWLLGGAGVQSSQMYLSVGLYIIIAIVIARMFGVEGKLETFLATTFLSVYPANLDRYSFPGSQIAFVVADTFAILAVLVLTSQKTTWKALTVAVPLLVLCLATYQPAIALAAFLILGCFILLLLQPRNDDLSNSNAFPLSRLATASAAMLLGMAIYFVTAKMTVHLSPYSLQRAHVNSISDSIIQILGSFPSFVKYFTTEADYLPHSLRWLPLTMILLGASSLIFLSLRKGFFPFFIIILLLALMPIALRATYIINSQSFANVGRFVYPYGFALLFFLVAIGKIRRLKILSLSVMALLIFLCTIIDTQETNRAYLKMIFDTNKINRIAARIENIIPDIYTKKLPLVVIGNLSMDDNKYKSYPNEGNRSAFNTETFADYRQPEFLNFYFGRNVFVHPTAEQRYTAILSTKGRRPWPAPDSVYFLDNIVVVLLEEYRPEISVTWTN